MDDLRSKDTRIFIWCTALLVILFVLDIAFHWTPGGFLYLFVIMLSLRSSKNKSVYFFAGITSVLLITSWRLFPSAAKIWHVSIALIWITAISGIRFKKEHIAQSALAAIVDSSFDAIVGMTLTNVVFSWNKAAENFFGYTSEEMLGQSAACLVPEDSAGDELFLLSEVRTGKAIRHYQTVRRHKDGHLIQLSLTLSPTKDPFGNIVGFSSIARDISERIIAEKKLKELSEDILRERNKISKVLSIEEHLNTIFDINKLVDFVVNKTAEILEAEKCSLMLVDYDTRELCIKGHKGIDAQFIHRWQEEMGASTIGIIAHDGRPILVTDIENDSRFLRKKRASYRTKSFISAPIKSGGNIMGFLNVADKNSSEGNMFSALDLKILCMITRQVAVAIENAKLYRELTHLTITDPLTQIYNFRYFTKAIDHEIGRLNRHSETPLCLLLIDVDNLTLYNDTFGHLQGDTLLQVMSRLFKLNIRDIDMVCRYAGDEFAVILPETEMSQAMIIAERIKRCVDGLSLKRPVTVSIGIAQCKTHTMNRYEVIQRAGIALSKAKKEGKNLIRSV